MHFSPSIHSLIYKGERGKRALFPFPSRDSSVGEFVAGVQFPFPILLAVQFFFLLFSGESGLLQHARKREN